MVQAALALATGLAVTLPPITPVTLHSACAAEIDPQFVRYVAPPLRPDASNSLLWLIADHPAGALRSAPPQLFVGCSHPIQVRDRR